MFCSAGGTFMSKMEEIRTQISKSWAKKHFEDIALVTYIFITFHDVSFSNL